MAERIGFEQIVAMLRGGFEQVRAHHEELSQLDSALGDGDHGSAMLRAAEAGEKAIEQNASGPAGKLLQAVAWGLMGAAGGAPGPLFGSFFLGMSEAVGDGELDADGVAGLFEAGLARLRKQTKAQPGEKTMLDALVPAVEALRSAAAGGDVSAALAAAAEAAGAGAESTKQMQARHGKARHMGERTLGHIDPGSMSATYLFRGFAEALAD